MNNVLVVIFIRLLAVDILLTVLDVTEDHIELVHFIRKENL